LTDELDPAELLVTFPHLAHQLLVPLVGVVVVDDEQGVDQAREVEEQREHDAQERLEGLPAEEHGQRGQDDGNEVEHGRTSYLLSLAGAGSA
jgi:hypothetical protein